MSEKLIRLELVLSRRQVIAAMAMALLAAASVYLGSETLTMTTYYPAPVGVYQKLTTTQQTVLARDGGNVVVGLRNPAAQLVVDGLLRVGNFAVNPAGGQEGAIYYNTASLKFMGYQGGQWKELGGGAVSGALFGACYLSGPAPQCSATAPASCVNGSVCQCPSGYSLLSMGGSGTAPPDPAYYDNLVCYKN